MPPRGSARGSVCVVCHQSLPGPVLASLQSCKLGCPVADPRFFFAGRVSLRLTALACHCTRATRRGPLPCSADSSADLLDGKPRSQPTLCGMSLGCPPPSPRSRSPAGWQPRVRHLIRLEAEVRATHCHSANLRRDWAMALLECLCQGLSCADAHTAGLSFEAIRALPSPLLAMPGDIIPVSEPTGASTPRASTTQHAA